MLCRADLKILKKKIENRQLLMAVLNESRAWVRHNKIKMHQNDLESTYSTPYLLSQDLTDHNSFKLIHRVRNSTGRFVSINFDCFTLRLRFCTAQVNDMNLFKELDLCTDYFDKTPLIAVLVGALLSKQTPTKGSTPITQMPALTLQEALLFISTQCLVQLASFWYCCMPNVRHIVVSYIFLSWRQSLLLMFLNTF